MLTVGNELAVSRLFIAFALAAVDSIWALYLNSFGLNASAVGFFTAALVVFSLGCAIAMPHVLRGHDLKTLFIASVGFSTIAYVVIGLADNLAVFIITAALVVIADVVRLNSFSILFRDNIKNRDLNAAEGLLYTLLNVGWFISPVMVGLLLRTHALPAIFIFAAAFNAIGLVLFLFIHAKEHHKTIEHFNILPNIKEYFKQRRLVQPYLVTVGLESWWAFIYIYVPLLALGDGVSEGMIAAFLGFVTLPLIITEYLVGKVSEKKPFRRLFAIGFGGLAILAIVAMLVADPLTRLAILASASFFAAFIEPLQDTFFFKQVDQDEENRFYPLFNTSGQVGSFLTKAAIACVLLFLPVQAAYVLVALFMAFMAVRSSMFAQ